MDNYKCIYPTVTDLSGVSDTKFIIPNTHIGYMKDFAVTVVSTATQVIAYRIQFSPNDVANQFATAGAQQTATSIGIGTATVQKVTNTFTNNMHGYMRIEASGACSVANAPLKVYIHGIRGN